MRGFKIWPQNSIGKHLIFFGKKKLSKMCNMPDLASFDSFWTKKGSNGVRFEF